jgi:hypothetical protein
MEVLQEPRIEKPKARVEPLIKKQKIRALSPSQIVNKQRVIYPFKDRLKDSFGEPEKIAKWFITGPSYSGKSSLIFTLCNELCEFGKVDYNNFEEGDSQTVAEKIQRHGLLDREGAFKLLPRVPVDEFKARLLKRKSAAFGVIDSVQHAEMSKHTYIQLTDTLCCQRRGKSLLFINHWVKNDLTKFIKHDCDIKIEVIGFVAHIESRYGGNRPFLIWEEGAKKYWQKKYRSVIDGKYWPGQKK